MTLTPERLEELAASDERWLADFPEETTGLAAEVRAEHMDRAAALRELAELKRKLPRAADGPVVTPRDIGFLAYQSAGRRNVIIVSGHFENALVCAGMHPEISKPSHWIGFYSTREAAEAALKEAVDA